MSAPIVVCVLGMHRSGTSVVTRLLNLLGVSLGPPHSLMPPGADNPRGYWEHHPFVRINDDLLARHGGRWDQPPAWPPAWSRDPALDDLRARVREVVAADFASSLLWGWKDPRTCLTLPFWTDLIGPVRCVVVIRNPASVAASLHRRESMAADRAAALWLTYVAASLRHSAGLPRLFLFHEDLMAGIQPQFRRLAAFVGRPAAADAPDVQRAALAFVDSMLWHHRVDGPALAADSDLPFAARGLYLALRELVPRGQPGDEPASGDAGAPHQVPTTSLAEAAYEEHRAATDAAVAAARLAEQSQAVAALTARTEILAAEVAAGSRQVGELSAALAAARAEVEAGATALAEAWAREAAQTRALGLERARSAELETAHQEADARARNLDALLRDTEARRQATTARAEAAEHQLGETRAALQAAARTAADLQHQLALLSDAHDRLRNLQQRTQATLDEIQTSAAWTIVSAARRRIVRALPAGTTRRRWFDRTIARFRAVPSPRPHS